MKRKLDFLVFKANVISGTNLIVLIRSRTPWALVTREGMMVTSKYREILKENLFQSTRHLNHGWRFTFQYDNDPE